MNDEPWHGDQEALTEEARRRWNDTAEWWDERMGEGDFAHRTMIDPAAERLLELTGGEKVLDVACGNGYFSRKMARAGARVVALDFSERFIQRARERTTEHRDRIDYRLVDATQESDLLALGNRQFDAAVCNTALMGMASLKPLASALTRLLKPGGRFVFSVCHPAFNAIAGRRMVVEEEDRDGELVTVYSVQVSEYIRPSVSKGIGKVGQPAAHLSFDRPISLLFNTFFEAGFVLDGVEEPTTDEAGTPSRATSWSNYEAQIPPFLVARMRLPVGR